MRAAIEAKLAEIEKAENVRILLAVESGSRAWGFESPDSDYDVRFIYIRSADDYLRLDPMRDVIEWELDDVYDINGWDIRKALRLLRDSNPTLMEWLASPIRYRWSDEADSLAMLAVECCSVRKAAHHYISMASGAADAILGKAAVKPKKYLYAIRAILAARWVMDRKTPPPVPYANLSEALLPHVLKDDMSKLLAMKAVTSELGTIPGIPILDGYIASSLEVLPREAQDVPKGEKVPWERLNKFFYSVLGNIQ